MSVLTGRMSKEWMEKALKGYVKRQRYSYGILGFAIIEREAWRSTFTKAA